ncbi:hypothetical protein BRW65_13175 [Mycobacterium paraffinicum]|uniref:DUF732 domain-containing protein n=1 Tax=Mycobacterium paraffinicum TaxID=53378 RepID=A0A1Q4HV23_9MYCO|nr:hypothetical protein BRW65_13175 [Mycobacterium paraffinicum]
MRRAGYGLTACFLGFASATVAMPAAHADPLDNIRGAVNGARTQSTCQPLAYSHQLETSAQMFTRNANVVPSSNPQGYCGHIVGFLGMADPTDKATSAAMDHATPYIHDCTFKDFGVGMFRDQGRDESDVAIVLGQPAAPAAPAPVPDSQKRVFCSAGGYELPPGSDCSNTPNPNPPPAPAPVTNAIQLQFGPPHLGSITATITNSSALTAKCTYDSTPSILTVISRSIQTGIPI